MDYSFKFSQWGRLFSVPTSVVDDYIKISDGNFVKVLLCIFCNGYENVSSQALSDMSGLSEEVVEDAVIHWTSLGVLSAEKSNSITSIPVIIQNPAVADHQKADCLVEAINPAKRSLANKTSVKYTTKELAEKIKTNSELKTLADQIQSVLGREINTIELGGIINIYEYYGFNVPCILMVAEYCHQIGKDKIAYIEAVAKDWFERDINTFDEIEKEVIRLTELGSYERQILRAVGLESKPSKKQSEYIAKWNEMGFSTEMVSLAYDKCVNNTNKLSFPYINKILEGWQSKGITTPKQADADDLWKKKNATQYKTTESKSNSYDLDEFEQFALNFNPNEK